MGPFRIMLMSSSWTRGFDIRTYRFQPQKDGIGGQAMVSCKISVKPIHGKNKGKQKSKQLMGYNQTIIND